MSATTTAIGICCLVAAVAYWCGARVERHITAIGAARRGDDRFARAHRIDPDAYAGRGDWAEREDVA